MFVRCWKHCEGPYVPGCEECKKLQAACAEASARFAKERAEQDARPCAFCRGDERAHACDCV